MAERATRQQRLGNVRWDAYDHRLLWDMIMDARPDDLFDRHRRWVRLGRRLVEVNKTVQDELNALFRTWEGTAAVSAALSNTRLLQWSQETAETTERIGEDLGEYANALVRARHRMPQPRHVVVENEFRAGDGGTVWAGPESAYTLLQLMSDHRATTAERAEAKERAVEVMRAFEADAARIERSMDTYSVAPPVTAAQPPGGPWLPDWDPENGPPGIELPPEPPPDPTGSASSAAGASAGTWTGVPGAPSVPGAGHAAGGIGSGGVHHSGGPGAGVDQGWRGPNGSGQGARAGGQTLYPPPGGPGRDEDREKAPAPPF